MRLIAVLLLLVTAGLVTAAACPPGPCNKYRQFPVEDQPTMYRRSVRGAAPARFDRAAIARFLAAGTWEPHGLISVGNVVPARPLRFYRGEQLTNGSVAERLVIIRQIDRRNGYTYVEVDGVFFLLSRCERRFACLEQVGSLPEPMSAKKRFATPP